MRLRVEGRVNSDFLDFTLPPTNVVVVTLATGTDVLLGAALGVDTLETGFLGAALRVLVLRAGFAAVDLDAVALVINRLVACLLIHSTGKGLTKCLM
tara:strand:+ start:113 stop:403 length:291 start_codon:yes stop_codon:yes gene_type:complete